MDVSEDYNMEVVKRKRGRPSKPKEVFIFEEEMESIDSMDVSGGIPSVAPVLSSNTVVQIKSAPVEVPQAPRKRGRPPGSKKPKPTPSENAVKRGRGRPRKNPLVASPNAQSMAATQSSFEPSSPSTSMAPASLSSSPPSTPENLEASSDSLADSMEEMEEDFITIPSNSFSVSPVFGNRVSRSPSDFQIAECMRWRRRDIFIGSRS